MAMTNDDLLAHRLRLFRNHGITRDRRHMTHAPDGDWYYQQIELGYNYRLTDLQAALGINQLTRIDDYVARRWEIAARYNRLLADLPLTKPYQDQGATSAWHLYVVRLQADKAGIGHRALFDHLRAAGIGVNLHYIPVHTQPYYRRNGKIAGYNDRSFPEAQRYYAEAISLPMYPTLSEVQQDAVVGALAGAGLN